MVASIRESVNKSSIFTSEAFLSHKLVQLSTNIDLNINIATPRERSLSHQSPNSRESSILFTTSSVSYHKRMECQSSNPSWSKQVETKITSLIVSDNSEQKISPDIQKPNNGHPVENQYVISKTSSLNNFSVCQI